MKQLVWGLFLGLFFCLCSGCGGTPNVDTKSGRMTGETTETEDAPSHEPD